MRIKEIIKEKGMTVAQVAEKMGVTPPSLSRAINGNTTVEMLNRISAVLGVQVSSLFDKIPESGLYGIIIFGEKTYKIDSDQALKEFLKDYDSKSI